jgi:hypothetical protein
MPVQWSIRTFIKHSTVHAPVRTTQRRIQFHMEGTGGIELVWLASPLQFNATIAAFNTAAKVTHNR